jgi:hypothetical protein
MIGLQACGRQGWTSQRLTLAQIRARNDAQQIAPELFCSHYLLTLFAHQEVKDYVGIVATQSYRTVKFQGNKAKITFPGYLVVCLHGEIRTAHGCFKSMRLIGANGLWER